MLAGADSIPRLTLLKSAKNSLRYAVLINWAWGEKGGRPPPRILVSSLHESAQAKARHVVA
jgi:hypothetical protein